MKIFPLTVLAVIATGCAGTRPYAVKFESEPPGARVFYSVGATAKQTAKNRSYLGQTPCTATITGTRSGYFHLPKIAYASDYVAGSATFTAEPPTGINSTPKSFTYRGPTEYVDGDKIPSGVFFDFTK